MKNIYKYSFIILALFLISGPAEAAEKCDFTRDLTEGSVGEDVRCLQKYLNNNGFVIATEGVGSPGNETSLFRTLTKETVARWQKANGLPASGMFGPASRARYNAAPALVIPPEVAHLISTTTPPVVINKPVALSGSAKKAADEIREALEMMQEAQHQMGKKKDDGESGSKKMSDALKNLAGATDAYFDQDYSEAMNLATLAYADAEEAFDDAGGKTKEDKADSAIDNARNDLDRAEDKINKADDDEKDVEDAEEIFEKAESKYDAAEEAYDDEDFALAEKLAKEASDLSDKAVSEIGGGEEEEEDAQDAIDEADEAIDEAKDEIDEADDDGKDVDDALDILSDAKSKLSKAEDALDDEDFDEAEELADEAKELAEEAVDAL